MERLRKACQLSARDWLFLGHAWILFLMVELGLRLLPFCSVLTWCHSYSQRLRYRGDATSLPSIERLAWLTTVAGRYNPVQSTCLREALVLSVLLERRSIAAHLRIGVSRDEDAFAAHAWLEQNGHIILGLQRRSEFEPLNLEKAKS
jgi:hypothetical protein